MREVDQYLDSLLDYVVAFLTANTGYEADTASIVLVRRIIESLNGR